MALDLVFVFLNGCGGAGAVAESVRPKDPTAAGALGESVSCHDPERYGEPLVVDWKPDRRGDLELAMHDGVAVVAYGCKDNKLEIKLMKDCKVEGNYGYLGMTRREQVVRLQNADEVSANLPLMGGIIAAKIGAEMQRGTTLDIALITVGKKRTTWTAPTRADLKGTCSGATHFVRGATVGAFVLATGSRAQLRSAAEVFGAGASASSSSSREVNEKEGDPSDCSKASPDSKSPPSQCGSAVRLELVAIPEPPPDTAKPEAKPLEEPALSGVEEPCPKGLVYAESKCTQPAAQLAHQCDPGNLEECTEQCDKGHAGSCGALGTMYGNGTVKVSRDYAKASAYFTKACGGGDVRSCVNLGEMKATGLGGAADPAAAATFFEKGCNEGDAIGCGHLGQAYRAGTGVARDEARATVLLLKACEGGQPKSCGALAALYAQGTGVTKDPQQAAKLYRRACDGNDGESCNAIGELSETRGDPILASMMYQRGCWTYPKACANHGRLLQVGPVKNDDMAKRQYERACFQRVSLGCAVLRVAFRDQRTFIADPRDTMALQSSCNAGSARDCGILGVLQVAGGMPTGKQTLDRACMMNDRWACEMKKY